MKLMKVIYKMKNMMNNRFQDDSLDELSFPAPFPAFDVKADAPGIEGIGNVAEPGVPAFQLFASESDVGADREYNGE
jgi:hypothetical protein